MPPELILNTDGKTAISKIIMKGASRQYRTSAAIAKALAFFSVPLMNCREFNTDTKEYVKSRVSSILDRLNDLLYLDVKQVLSLTEQFYNYRVVLAFPDIAAFSDNDALSTVLDIKVAFNQPTLDQLRFLDPVAFNNDYILFCRIVQDNL